MIANTTTDFQSNVHKYEKNGNGILLEAMITALPQNPVAIEIQTIAMLIVYIKIHGTPKIGLNVITVN